MQDIYVVAAKRTAIGNFMGSLSTASAVELGSTVLKALLEQTKVPSSAVSEVILGQVLTAGQGQNPARQAAIKAGIDIATPSYVVSQVCGSGLKAIELGVQSIALGKSDIVICGGQENMSQAMHAATLRSGAKFGDISFTDLMLKDGLTDAFSGEHMGITAENIAKKYNISRQEQDAFAYQSQMKAASSAAANYFTDEIVPVSVKHRKETIIVDKDEFIKSETSLEKLAKLRPAFQKDGTVTAANSSGINDGAAAVMLASRQAIEEHNLTPIAKITGSAVCGVDPDYMGTGPIPAIQKLLQQKNLTAKDIDIFELNEAFAAQSISVMNALSLNAEKVNINGGAIALGHPIGASGARVLVTLLHSMNRLGAQRGVASLCIGGGMGIAMLVESVK